MRQVFCYAQITTEKKMNIDQIISTTPDQEARDHIRRQYQSDLQVLGGREALEFARFRADALADAPAAFGRL